MTKQRSWTSAAARRILAAVDAATTVEEAVTIIAHRFLLGLSFPPTDLDGLGLRLRVHRFRSMDIPVAGELRRSGQSFEVVYAPRMPVGRVRFTIAHELAHAFLETTGPGCPTHGSELERLCDLFAVEILLPKDRLAPLFSAPLGLPTILTLVDRCAVSRPTAAYRCHELYQLHSFEVSRRREIVFTTGLVRRIEYEVHEQVTRVLRDGPTRGLLYLQRNAFWNGPWRFEGTPIGTRGHAIFALLPVEEREAPNRSTDGIRGILAGSPSPQLGIVGPTTPTA